MRTIEKASGRQAGSAVVRTLFQSSPLTESLEQATFILMINNITLTFCFYIYDYLSGFNRPVDRDRTAEVFIFLIENELYCYCFQLTVLPIN